MPEPISFTQPNSCQLDEPEPLSCIAPAATAVAPLPAESAPAVRQLVAAHPSSAPSKPVDCTAEGVMVATAATHSAVSLAKAIVSAPTEVGLALTLADFIVDAVALGAATAKLMNCEEQRASRDAARPPTKPQ